MLYGISGLPGSGKTLNAIAKVLNEKQFSDRPIYYYYIPCLMFDYEICKTFQGWFYGYYYHNNKGNTALVKRVRKIHQQEERLVEADDFTHLRLEADFERHRPLDLFLFWVRRCYPAERLEQLDEMLEIKGLTDETATFSDIEPLRLHWSRLERPEDWFTAPKESVCVIDEIHQVWPTRPKGAVPDGIKSIDTHRHHAKDLIFITQDFANCDVYLRRFIGHHTHYENVGKERVASFTRKKFIDINNPFDKKSADKTVVKRPVQLYDSYYSTDMDTEDKSLSKKVRNGLILGGVSITLFLVVLFGGLPYLYYSFFGEDEPQTEITEQVVTTSNTETQTTTQALSPPTITDVMPWMQPQYKNVVAVQSYPDLMCYTVRDECRCVTQQSTRYSLDDSKCRILASNGVFDPNRADRNQKLKEKKGASFL